LSLDIIIPALNEYQNLKILIPYLKQHLTNNDTKIIVVDAANSNDNTEQLCLQQDTFYLKSKHNQRAAQMNAGAQQSEADCILFLHADVMPPTTFYEDIYSMLSLNFDFGLFAYRLDSARFLLKINSYFTQFDMIMAGGGDQCQFMTKECYTKLKGYNENYEIMEDFEFFERLKKSSFKYGICQSQALVSARKYNDKLWLKVNLTNLLLFVKFKMGASPESLKKLHDKWLG